MLLHRKPVSAFACNSDAMPDGVCLTRAQAGSFDVVEDNIHNQKDLQGFRGSTAGLRSLGASLTELLTSCHRS